MIPPVSTLVKYDAAQSVSTPFAAFRIGAPRVGAGLAREPDEPASGPRAPSRDAIDR